MTDWKKDDTLRGNAIRFIEAACSIIESDGLDAISVRKVAEIAGFHNSTIYTYFRDADRLTQIACVRYLAPYAKQLADISTCLLTPYDTFYRIWEAYFTEAFANPHIFHLLFFGKYSGDISGAMEIYYDLFPKERESWSETVEEMYLAQDYESRCLAILTQLADDTRTRVTHDNLNRVNTLIVSYTKGVLERKCAGAPQDGGTLTQECLDMLHFVLDKG